MKTYRTLTTIGGLFLTASLALAQVAAPLPPAPPAPAPRAIPAPPAPVSEPPMPLAPLEPMPPMPALAPDVADAIRMAEDALSQATPMPMPAPMPDVVAAMRMAEDALNQATLMPMPTPMPNIDIQTLDNLQLQIEKAAQDAASQKDSIDVRDKLSKAQEKLVASNAKMAEKLSLDMVNKSLAMQVRTVARLQGGDEGWYQQGLRFIDNHQYDSALTEFDNVLTKAGPRAEGALYWKAYVLNKLGRAAEAQTAIDALRKTYPNSRWLDDAKALELEVKQSKGPVSPDAESDDDLKVLALTGLMQSDPEKALPQVENLLKGSHSPNLKRQALFVIAQNNSPKAQQMLEQIARGGNPDLQARAIQYMSQKRNPNTPQILLEIYTSTTDPAVKRAVLDAFSGARDKDHLLQIVRSEKDANLRSAAIGRLGAVDGQPELWQIYQSETAPEGKIAVLNAMRPSGNLEKLTEVARTDKDPKVRQKAIEVIASQQSGAAPATLAELYAAEQDATVKQTIIDHLSGSRSNCKPLVDVAKSEKDLKMKLRIVQRLSGMTTSCPAATEYLTELLSK